MTMTKKLILDPYWGVDSFQSILELVDLMTQEIFTPKDLGVTYTNITYWDRQGILNSKRASEGKWRNFNFLDYTWLRTIDQLREIGVSTKIIRTAKEKLFTPIDMKPLIQYVKEEIKEIKKTMTSFKTEKEKDEYINTLFANVENNPKDELVTEFYMGIIQSIKLKVPVNLIIFPDGEPMMLYSGAAYEQEKLMRIISQSHVNISITRIIKDFFVDANAHSIHMMTELQLLEPNEISLLQMVNSGDYDSINIIFKDKKMKELELNKTQDNKRKLMDIMKEGNYQDIVIKSHKGMVTRIQNTVKVKL